MKLRITLFLIGLAFSITACDVLPELSLPPLVKPTLQPLSQPSATSAPTATLPETPDPEPSATPIAESDDELPTVEPQDVPLDISGFTLQEDGPFYLPNFTHPTAGCDWLGVAGQVFDHDGNEQLGLTIMAGNVTEGEENTQAAITGLSTAYGPGGYEIQLSSQPVDSSGVYWVQVLNQEGEPLSEQLFFDTAADCESNLVLVNFVPLEDPNEP